MRLTKESAIAHRLCRLNRIAIVAALQVLAIGCGGRAQTNAPPPDAAPEVTSCDSSPCVRELAVGTGQVCARLDDGSVRCWGANFHGQAGVDSSEAVTRPTTLRLTARAQKLRAGAQTSCAFAAGQVWCWGANSAPGNWNDQKSHAIPSLIPNPDIVDIGLGQDVLCTLSKEGQVACRGDNSYGNLGLADGAADAADWTPIPELSASALSVGYGAACATQHVGNVSCWGDNRRLLIGREETSGPAIAMPRTVPELTGFEELVLSQSLACGVDSKQRVRCWGINFDAGPSPVWPPNPIAGGEGLSRLSINDSACALDHDDNVHCWGSNQGAQLGSGKADDRLHPMPTLVEGLSSIASIAVGFNFACALSRTGHVLCWGANDWGQLGIGQTDKEFHTPTEVRW